jgi:hypothetical protein
MTRPMTPIMKIIPKPYNTMFLLNFVMFIHFELFVMYVLMLFVHSLYIVGDRTKMVDNRSPRQVLSVYQRLLPPD